ncbi:hypothetical protein NA56DRAFT_708033 [Hyaloscypha hepaticicola]|uniref:Actin-like ATPase domain-containing protein n=1 Tax=Hyaloscypha hepaticicola TaxID=2082293 RepID=A0A2J6PSZ9_9HELO|nr:hypothetical protein NA56DRAFT_708033 [Hyaloscypha hepaticicola]
MHANLSWWLSNAGTRGYSDHNLEVCTGSFIYDSRGDSVSAEGCRTFFPGSLAPVDLNPQIFLDTVLTSELNSNEEQNQPHFTTLTSTPSGPSLALSSQYEINSQASTSSTVLRPFSGTMTSSVEVINRKLDEQTLEPKSLFSIQIDTSNKVDGTSHAKYARDNLTCQSPSLTGRSISAGDHNSTVPWFEPSSQAEKRSRLVIAVDFGMTHTSVAWALVGTEGVREGLLSNWPGASSSTDPSFNDFPTPRSFPKYGTQEVKWLMLRLMGGGNSYNASSVPPSLPPAKSEIDLSEDFLLKVRMAVISQLEANDGALFFQEEGNIHYYFTIPGVWNDAG